METPHFLAILAVGVALAAGSVVLASVLDVPGLRVVAVVCIVGVFVAREVWMWRGAGRAWLAMLLAVLLVVAAAFVVQRLSA